MWGVYTRQYVAFPLFNAPKGTIAQDPDPDQLVDRMRRWSFPAGHAEAPVADTGAEPSDSAREEMLDAGQRRPRMI